jgi:molybdenum cofactor synthesis domain-containing protein
MTINRVAILVVGDEILSGDTQETNAHYMACALSRVGASLGRIVVVPDDLSEIARFSRELSDEFDVVITSGGIGPTHDDVTMEGIALGLGLPLAAHPQLLDLLSEWRGSDLDDATARLALVPEGALLHWVDSAFPLVQIRNLYVLPGVPRLLRKKFDALLSRIEGEPTCERQFSTEDNELSFAAALREVQAAHPRVVMGSYPYTPMSKSWAVRLVLKARDQPDLDAACAALESRLPGLVEQKPGPPSEEQPGPPSEEQPGPPSEEQPTPRDKSLKA